MKRQPDLPKSDLPEKTSLEAVMLAARMKAREEAPPIVAAQKVSQLRLREVFGDLDS